MSWSSGGTLYIEIIELLLATHILSDAQMLMLAADLKLLFEGYDCDSIDRDEVVDIIMKHYY